MWNRSNGEREVVAVNRRESDRHEMEVENIDRDENLVIDGNAEHKHCYRRPSYRRRDSLDFAIFDC